MKLYRAETGRLVDWQSNSAFNIETLEDLYQAVESNTGIPVESQILMTSYGNIVKKENVREVIEATGEREYIVFCYDRDLLSAHPDQVSGILDRELPTLEPEIPDFDGAASLKQLQQSSKKKSISENCDAYVTLFVKFDSHSRSLIKSASAHTSLASATVEEQKLQSMALSVALANLKTHIGSGRNAANQFIESAKKELNRQSGLLKSLQNDIDILKHTHIHPSILESIEPSQQNRTKLIDFIDLQHIDIIKADTIDLCNYLNSESTELKKVAQEIVTYERHLQEHIASSSNLQSLDATLADIKSLQSKAQVFRDEMKKSLPRIYDTISKLTEKPISALFENLSLNPSISSESSSSSIMPPVSRRDSFALQQQQGQRISTSAAKKKFESFNHLAEYQLDDPLLKLSKCEVKIRQQVDGLIDSKRDSITEFFNNMKVIADLQDHIALLQQQSEGASQQLEDFKLKYGKKDLESVRQISFAYGALLIEIVRRKEYMRILVKNSNILADVLAEYRHAEEIRREHFRQAVTKILPFKLVEFDKASPQSEITLNGANEYDSNNKTTVLDKQDITEFISLIGAVYFQPSAHQGGLSRRPSFLSSSSSSSSQQSSGSRRNSSQHSPKSTSSKVTKNNGDENLAKLLNFMFKQMNDMRSDFLKTIEHNFFTVNKVMIDPARIKEVLEKQEEVTTPSSSAPRFKLVGGSSANDKSNGQAVAIPSTPLSPLRQTSYAAVSTVTASAASAIPNTPPSPKSNSSSSSSTFSVVEDDKKLVLTYIEENTALKNELESAKQENELLAEKNRQHEQNNKNQEEEIQILREAFKNLESEKEEFESQIQNLDQLVDNERQTFEQNRQSFLQELKNKDNSADFRIQSAEEDFQSKISDLQYELEEEKRMKKNLEIEHRSELNTMVTEHSNELIELRTQLAEEKETSQEALSGKWELERRVYSLTEDLATVKSKLETERAQYEDQLGRLQADLEDKEKATDEIKLLQQQTRSMVKRAQDDWEAKNEELKNIRVEQEIVDVAVRDLLHRFRLDDPKLSRELDLKTDINLFKENLEEFTQRYDDLQYNYGTVTQELAEVTEAYKSMTEVHNEWRTMASHMAEKLEEYRKSVVYELTQRLQLPMDEGELNVLSRNITPSDDDLAIWNQILHLASSIPTQNFVLRILDHAKNSHDRHLQYKTQYKSLKEKYNKMCINYCEKIAFRNFKPGDVALFLPTRNSTGKPWAAFNINAPHYFLMDSSSAEDNNIAAQMKTREWIVARIVTITEHVTDENVPESNPYGLNNGIKYYQLETEPWRNAKHNTHKSKKRMTNSTYHEQQLQDNGLASLTSHLNQPTAEDSSSSNSMMSGSPPAKRPSFSNSSTSSNNNIVHSYINK